MKRILLFAAAALALFSCSSPQSEEEKPGEKPGDKPGTSSMKVTVRTGQASGIEQSAAVLNGSYTIEGTKDLSVLLEYFYFSTAAGSAAEIKAEGEMLEVGPYAGPEDSFSLPVTDLTPSTTYYYVAAVNWEGKEYLGETVSFTTADLPPREESVTGTATDITEFSAVLSGYAYTAHPMEEVTTGILYSTDENPTNVNGTILTAETIDENNRYSVKATGLTPGTTYYFLSFLQHTGNTLWGEVRQFTTPAVSAEVTTLDAGNIGMFAATVGGRLQVNSQEEMETEAWILLGGSGSLDALKTSGTRLDATIQPDGTFTCSKSGLSYNTTYHFVACARVHQSEFYGNILSFKTKDISASVTSRSATDVELSSATLNGSLSAPGTETLQRSVWFLFGENGSLESLKSSGTRLNASLSSDGSFHYSKTGLNYNTTYYYVACAQVDDRVFYGTPVSFKTKDIEVIVNTEDATDIEEKKFIVHGSIVLGSGLSASHAWFLVSKTATTLDDLKSNANPIYATPGDDGGYQAQLSLLNPNTTYYYVACARVNDKEFYGQVKTVTTLDNTIVDMGMSVRWRSCNVAASKPEGLGSLVAWGATRILEYYGWPGYCWGVSENGLLKYNTKSEYGIVDNLTTLELADDVAHVYLGGNWRMPTFDEWKELLDNCTVTTDKIGTQNGLRLTSNRNGKSIFLPCSGFFKEQTIKDEGTKGMYWSSSLDTTFPSKAFFIHFEYNHTYIYRPSDGAYRYLGLSVRPVTK